MIASSQSALLDRWWQRVGGPRRNATSVRPFAALTYVAIGPISGRLGPLKNIAAVVAYDEPLSNGGVALRLKVCESVVQRENVVWGGELGTTRVKDLRLMPEVNASAFRVDLSEQWLLWTGLWLEREIHLRDRQQLAPNRRSFAVPRLWAGFRPIDAVAVRGTGAELDTEARNRRLPPETVLLRATRAHGELVLFPHGWVGPEHPRAVGLFADLHGLPRCQVITLNSPADLVGLAGAARFDFLNPRTFSQISRPSLAAARTKMACQESFS